MRTRKDEIRSYIFIGCIILSVLAVGILNQIYNPKSEGLELFLYLLLPCALLLTVVFVFVNKPKSTRCLRFVSILETHIYGNAVTVEFYELKNHATHFKVFFSGYDHNDKESVSKRVLVKFEGNLRQTTETFVKDHLILFKRGACNFFLVKHEKNYFVVSVFFGDGDTVQNVLIVPYARKEKSCYQLSPLVRSHVIFPSSD